MRIFGKEALLTVLACIVLGASPATAVSKAEQKQPDTEKTTGAAKQTESDEEASCGEDKECLKECDEDKECIKEYKKRQTAASNSGSSGNSGSKAAQRSSGTRSAGTSGSGGGRQATGTSGGSRQAGSTGAGSGTRERLMGAGGVKSKENTPVNQPKSGNQPKAPGEDGGSTHPMNPDDPPTNKPKDEPKNKAKVGEQCSTNDAGSVRLDESETRLIVCMKSQGEEGDALSWQAVAGKRMYSATCEDWAESGFPSKESCITDGRWHLVYQNDADGNTIGGSIKDLKRHAANGADVKNATADASPAGGIHSCQTIGWSDENECLVACFDGVGVSGPNVFNATITPNQGIGLGAAVRRCDSKRIVSNIIPKTDGTPLFEAFMRDGGAAFNWFVKY